ncbi:MAG: VOC family protein [Gemmatimonadaceae bacterium]
MHGQFTWYELTTPDVEASKTFYPRFTGWGLQPFDADYTMFTNGPAPVAGIFRLSGDMQQQGVPPNWMAYVEVNNVDATAQQATSLGGKVLVGPADIPGTGRFAVVQDPQGATIGLYRSSGASQGWDGAAALGRPSWHELMTDDYKKANDFYGALFGWKSTGEMDMGGGSMYAMFGHEKVSFGGMYNRMKGMEGMPPFWLLYLHVKDVAQAIEAATKGGAKVIRPRMPIPGGTVAILSDPQGAAFALHDANAMPMPSAPSSAPAAKAPAKKAPAKKAAAKKAAAKKAKAPVKKAAKAPARKVAKKAAVKKVAKKAVKAVKKAARAVLKKVVKRAKPASKRTVKKATRAKPAKRRK